MDYGSLIRVCYMYHFLSYTTLYYSTLYYVIQCYTALCYDNILLYCSTLFIKSNQIKSNEIGSKSNQIKSNIPQSVPYVRTCVLFTFVLNRWTSQKNFFFFLGMIVRTSYCTEITYGTWKKIVINCNRY